MTATAPERRGQLMAIQVLRCIGQHPDALEPALFVRFTRCGCSRRGITRLDVAAQLDPEPPLLVEAQQDAPK